MPRLLPRQTPDESEFTPKPETHFVDGILINGHDMLSEKRAAHRARLAADREDARDKARQERQAANE